MSIILFWQIIYLWLIIWVWSTRKPYMAGYFALAGCLALTNYLTLANRVTLANCLALLKFIVVLKNASFESLELILEVSMLKFLLENILCYFIIFWIQIDFKCYWLMYLSDHLVLP